MQKLSTFVLVLAILFTLIASNDVHARYKGDMIFWEDFENYHDDNWLPSTQGSWEVLRDPDNNVKYKQTTTLVSGSDPYLNSWSLYKADDYRDFTLTLKARSDESGDLNSCVEMGVLFHYRNENNYYYVNFSSEAEKTVLVKKVAGKNTVLARCASPIVQPNDFFSISIKTIAGKIVVMANDIVIFQVHDNTFSYGKVGLGVLDDAASFDDIVMCKLVELDVEFHQDFNDNALTGWKADHAERWSTSFRDHTSYSLYLHTNEWNYWDRSRLGEIMTINNIEAKNFKFECDLKTVSGDTSRDLAMVFCYYDELNYYAAIFHHGLGDSRIMRVKNGHASILATYSGRCLEDFEWHEATVIAQDNHYSVYYDAAKIMEVTDTQLVVGKVGLGSLNNTGYFDNVTVEGEGIDQQKITLGSPNGTETLVSGSIHRINWISDHISNNVALEYTIDNGQTWTTIITSILNEFYYDWLVPNVNSSKCRVRVRDVDDYPMDESDRIFTIVPAGDITVLAPKAGDVYYTGDIIGISWESNNTSGMVDIEFSSNGGSSWTIIAGDVTDNGSYRMTAGDIESKSCIIRVSDADGFPIAESGMFKIFRLPEGASVIKPFARAEDFCPGDTVTIAVHVGDSSYPVQGLFGASYNFNYAPTQYLSVIDIKIGDFLGNDVIHFEQNNGAGTISAGVTRKNGAGGVSGEGDLLLVQLVINENAPEGQELYFSISDVNANTETGVMLDLRAKELVVQIETSIPVWPGDTNNDGIVNQMDILPIGLYWSKVGPKRDPQSMEWKAWKCPKGWDPEAAMYADCNGNGKIEASDILAIGLNWAKTNRPALAKSSGTMTQDAATASMSLFCQGNGSEESPYYVDIQVNDVIDLLGVSFNLVVNENAEYITFNTVQYTDFFGTDLVTFESIDNENTMVSVGATRKSTDGGIEGSGSLCRVYFTISQDAPVMSRISFELADLTANDSQGGSLALEAETTTIMTGVSEHAQLPTAFELEQNYPNPFNPTTKIGYAVPAETHVTMRIYNTLGQVVKTLIDAQMAPGRYSVVWDGTSDMGMAVSPGIYFARLHNSEQDVQLIKMVLAK